MQVIGSDRSLSNGNTLIDFGYKNDGSQSNIIEVDSNNNQVFNLTISSSKTDRTYVYRALRVKFTPSNFVFDATKQFYAQLKEASAFLSALLFSRLSFFGDFGDDKQTDYLKGWMADFGDSKSSLHPENF